MRATRPPDVIAKIRPPQSNSPARRQSCTQYTSEWPIVSTVISICFFDTTCSAPASGFNVPKASECISTRSVPFGSASMRCAIISTVSMRYCRPRR